MNATVMTLGEIAIAEEIEQEAKENLDIEVTIMTANNWPATTHLLEQAKRDAGDSELRAYSYSYNSRGCIVEPTRIYLTLDDLASALLDD